MRNYISKSKFSCRNQNILLLLFILVPLALYPQIKQNQIFINPITEISEISTNTKGCDFAPHVVQDSLYFTTFNQELKIKGKESQFCKLYKSVIDKEGNTISKRYPVEPFITQFNEGPVSYCKKTGELYITANYSDQSVQSKKFTYKINRLRIIITKQRSGKWVQVSEFPYNNKNYSVGHPAITQSGDTLIFSSDRPGGYGETDLYFCTRENGKWNTPVNMGSKINTSGKDEFPSLTIQQNRQFLMFSSKGRFGFGDYDIYYTRFPSDFSEISHFESPVNTEYADFAMTIPTNSAFGYLTSNRPGTGNDDIYKFNFKPFIQELPNRILYAIDKHSKHKIPEVLIVDNQNILYVTDKEGKITNLPCDGAPSEITATTFGYQEKTKTLTPCGVNSSGIARDTVWMEIEVNKKITLKNIYFDFNTWNIRPESAKDLDRLVSLMKENPDMKVILSSHTDDRGTELYNLKLSQSRAQSSVGYVISQGIDKSRITGMGYGKTQLIFPNVQGIKNRPEQNRENRRTEIFIPGFLSSEGVKQQDGDFADAQPVNLIEKTYPPVEKEPQLKRDDPVSIEPETKFYVILGSFQDINVATELAQNLSSQGNEPLIIQETKQFRVGIEYSDYKEATKAKEKYHQIFKTAWVLIQKKIM